MFQRLLSLQARSVPRFVQRLRIVEFTLDHEAPVFSDMRRRTSRKVNPSKTLLRSEGTLWWQLA